ncbi:MAG: phenylalanine--tRNA ligase subunit beta [Rickettsiales bacterium]|jgi:phenylalanyl-tRNA synthetase beta chain
MKFTLSWLKDHLETTATLREITDKLTAIGLELEGVEDRGAALSAFTVAKIIEANRHPEADKLQICRVESDAGELQIVCGAANARAGLYVALAKEGTVIPTNGMVIKKTKIRGVESCGMLCSLEELGLAESSEGIMELPEAKIGAKVVDILDINDPVIDIAITPNRADCLGVRGVARDLAAAGIGTLKPLPAINFRPSFNSSISVSIETSNCQQFIGCYIKGIKNTESPAWLKARLEAIGQKSISALVDITNYFTFDLGRPLHVYDANKLNGNLVVSEAKQDEKLAVLNGKEYELPVGITVIADAQKPLAIGGIIGGIESGCTENTKDIFLEVALFDPISVAFAGRALQIDSDARYRFERGVDVSFVEETAKRAVTMIIELCGGQASELTYAGKTPEWKREISFNPQRVKSLGGVDVSPEKCEKILFDLGFSVICHPSSVICTPPSWRADIEGEADLVEEILRIYGYEHIPATMLPKLCGITPSALSMLQKRIHLAKRLLAGRGMLELQTWSFLPAAQAEMFGGNNPALTLLNPISADLDTMRPSVLPNLLDAAKRNAARGFKDANLFEVGLQFHDITPDGQKTVAAGIRVGDIVEQDYKNSLFTQKTRSVDAMDVKADAVALLQTLGLTKIEISTTNLPAYYHPNRSGAFVLGKNIIGYFGEIHPKIAAIFDLENKVAAFEIFLDAIPVARSKGTNKPALKTSAYQAVERDFAFIVDENITCATIQKEIAKADKNLITSVCVFDVYSGKGVDAGKKSVAVKVTLQSFEHTLSETDITAVSSEVLVAAGKGFGGILRQ